MTQWKLGRDLEPGDRLIRDADGQVLTIKQLTNGIYRGSRIAEYGRGEEWGSVFDGTRYEVVGNSAPAKKAAK